MLLWDCHYVRSFTTTFKHFDSGYKDTLMDSKLNHKKRNIFQRLPNRISRHLKRFYHRFLKLRGSPRQAALGMALGVFVGMSPFLGFHTAIAVLLASLFKWSKIAAAVGVLITNPITAPIIYPLTFRLGASLTGFSEPIQWSRLLEPGAFIALMKNSPMIIVDMLVGGILLGIPLYIAVYFITHTIVSKARKRFERRTQRKQKQGTPRQSQGYADKQYKCGEVKNCA